MKLVFHEGTNMSQAMAETVGYVNRARAFMPPGTVPPFITRFDAGSVAVGLLVFSSADAHAGRDAGFRPQPRAPAVRHAARRFRAAALRRQPAHHRRHARSRQAAAVPHLARGGHRRGQQSHPGDAFGQHVDRQRRAHRPHQRRAGRQSRRAAEHAHPPGFRHHGLPARHRHHRERHRSSSPPTRTSTASAPSTSPSPSAPTPPRWPSSTPSRRPSPTSRRSCPTMSTCAWNSTNRPT